MENINDYYLEDTDKTQLSDWPFSSFDIIKNKIETAKNKAELAMQYIKDLGTFNSIDYAVLGRYLQDIDHLDDRTYWSLYLLERSIPRREGDTKSWQDRLLDFYDTYLLEHAVNYKWLAGMPGPCLFATKYGNISHEKLCAGRGAYWPDFYIWDKKNDHFFAFLELKHTYSSIQAAANSYCDPKKRYNAKYVIFYLINSKTFTLVEYDKSTVVRVIDQPKLKAPDGLLLLK